MTKKKGTKIQSYIANTGLQNDVTGKRFEKGEKFSGAEFAASTIENWLKSKKIRQVKA